MSANLFKVKQEMCEIGRRIWIKGFCAGNEGNHSVRVSDDRVLVTPTGISKGFLTPDQICVVDMDGKQIDTDNKMKRTSEVLLHLALYKRRPDVKAVIHSHPPHATAFAIADVPLPEGVHPEAEVFLGRVPMAAYTTPGYKELGESIVALVKDDTNTVLMGNHGTVSFHSTLMDTYYKLEIIDAYCRILLLTKQVGKMNILSQDQMTDLLKLKDKFGLKDNRLACVNKGCVGTENDEFLATFEDVPASACSSDGATASGKSNEAAFEALVKQVADQIIAGMKK